MKTIDEHKRYLKLMIDYIRGVGGNKAVKDTLDEAFGHADLESIMQMKKVRPLKNGCGIVESIYFRFKFGG